MVGTEGRFTRRWNGHSGRGTGEKQEDILAKLGFFRDLSKKLLKVNGSVCGSHGPGFAPMLLVIVALQFFWVLDQEVPVFVTRVLLVLAVLLDPRRLIWWVRCPRRSQVRCPSVAVGRDAQDSTVVVGRRAWRRLQQARSER